MCVLNVFSVDDCVRFCVKSFNERFFEWILEVLNYCYDYVLFFIFYLCIIVYSYFYILLILSVFVIFLL